MCLCSASLYRSSCCGTTYTCATEVVDRSRFSSSGPSNNRPGHSLPSLNEFGDASERTPGRMQNNISCGHGPSIVRLENKIDRMFLILENQNEELTEMKRLMLRVLRGSNNALEAQPLPDGVQFPLSSLDNLWNLEQHLLDPNKSLRVLAELTIIGGDNLKEIVCQLLRTTFSSSLAEQFCWKGSSEGKRSFSELKLKDLVMRAVRKNSKTKEATNNEIKKCVQEWFRSAPDRNGRRNKRQRPAE